MLSRLVLLGLVGALGITIPTRKEAAEWLDAAQSWAIARLADWDGASPPPHRFHAHHPTRMHLHAPSQSIQTPLLVAQRVSKSTDASRIDASKSGQSLPSLPSNVFAEDQPSTVATSGTNHPKLVSQSDAGRLLLGPVGPVSLGPLTGPSRTVSAVPLTRRSGTVAAILLSGPSGNVSAAALTRPSGSVSTVALTRPSGALSPEGRGGEWPRWSDDLDAGLFVELCGVAEQAGVSFEASETQVQAQRLAGCFEEDEAELLAFDQALEGPNPKSVMQDPRPSPSFVPMEIGPDLQPGIAYELNRASEGIAIIARQGEAPQLQKAPPDRSERSALATRASGSVRVALNPPAHLSERHPAAAAPGPIPSPALDPALGRAVRLTRDAFRAWVSVLTGRQPLKVTTL
jgi:hypothetical protein